MTEKATGNIPLLDKLISDLGNVPEGELVIETLNQEDLEKLMGDIVSSSIANQPGLIVSSNLNIAIDQRKGNINGYVDISHPKAGNSKVTLDLTFRNSLTRPNLIETEGQPVVKPQLDLKASLWLSTQKINVPDEVKKIAADPNASIFRFLQSQLKPKGQLITYLQAQFTPDDKFELGFKSKKI